MFWTGLTAAALSVALWLWLLGHPWVAYPDKGSGTTESKPPFWWPWVCALSPVCAPFVTWHMRRTFERWRTRAGLGARWSAREWFAARLMLAAGGALLLGGSGLVSDVPPSWLLAVSAAGGALGYAWPACWLRRSAWRRQLVMMRELPFMLDLLTLCVEAGLSLPSALQQVARHAPAGPLRDSLNDAAALERTGMSRSQWLARWAETTDVSGVRSLVLTLAQADRLGMSLGPLLRAQSAQQRSERFLRAEKLALEAPVRMLFPMVLCIFPCTFLVIGFPVAVKLLQSGL
ncbi:type II secretion system F family protein [Castellaniella sp. UC4442_H9]|jgi:tight adherence protein C